MEGSTQQEQIASDLEVKAVLTVDIVNFSTRDVPEQTNAVQVLIKILGQALRKGVKNPNAIVWSPSGDGGSMTYWDASNQAALHTAIEICRLIREYNENRQIDKQDVPIILNEELQVRIGIHSGTVAKMPDFDDRENIWGDGINMSARLISVAKPNQILMSEDYHRDANVRGSWHKYEIISIGKWWAKHNKSITLYNVSNKDVGLPMSEVDEWYGPLNYPLEHAIRTYEGMLREEITSGQRVFRIAVIAKRILDIDPDNRNARYVLESISEKRHKNIVGHQNLYDKFFSPLSPATIVHFFTRARFRTFSNGDTIFQQDDLADSMMVVVSGELNLYRNNEIVAAFDSERGGSYTFSEGQIIGEMGLFDAAERRSATIKAGRRAITLSIDYEHVRPVPGSSSSRENMQRLEIQQRVWEYYCDRTIENRIICDELFCGIPVTERQLIKDDAEFLPNQYQHSFKLDVNDLENYWIIVIAGTIVITTANSQGTKEVEYTVGNYLGPIFLYNKFTGQNPYHSITEISPDAQIVRIHKDVMFELAAKYSGFMKDCLKVAHDELSRLRGDSSATPPNNQLRRVK